MRRYIWGLAGLAVFAACDGADPDSENHRPFAPTVSPDELSGLVGDDWEGELTYRGQGNAETGVTVPVELLVGQNGRTFELHFSFPENRQADGRAEVTISEDGRRINDEMLVRRLEDDGTLMLVTQQACEENSEPGTCEYTYMIAPHAFGITRMVRPKGPAEPFQASRYLFTRP